jgi:hypothetical protein
MRVTSRGLGGFQKEAGATLRGQYIGYQAGNALSPMGGHTRVMIGAYIEEGQVHFPKWRNGEMNPTRFLQ